LRRPVRLVYSETHASEAQAIKRERQIKGWSRAKKEALIAGKLQDLARRAKTSSLHKGIGD
jgi:putative endonuclease